MADFADSGDENEDNEDNDDNESFEEEPVKPTKGRKSEPKVEEPFDFAKPRKMKYCPTCSLPPEFCEFGQTFEKCLPWILDNCPEAVSEDVLTLWTIKEKEEIMIPVDQIIKGLLVI